MVDALFGTACSQTHSHDGSTAQQRQQRHTVVDALLISHAVTVAAAAAPIHPDSGSGSLPWWMHSWAHTSVGIQREQARDMMWGVNCVNCSCGFSSESGQQVVVLGWMEVCGTNYQNPLCMR